MIEILETFKSIPKTQKDIGLVVIKASNVTYKTQPQREQNAIFRTRIDEEAVGFTCEAVDVMDKEIELRDNKIIVSADKFENPNGIIVEKMEKNKPN